MNAREAVTIEFWIFLVNVRMKMNTGYLSAAEWPLLPVCIGCNSFIIWLWVCDRTPKHSYSPYFNSEDIKKTFNAYVNNARVQNKVMFSHC